MQMAWTATASTSMPSARTARTARGLADLQRVHQGIKALTEQLVDLCHDTAQFGTIKMALHHVDDILHQ